MRSILLLLLVFCGCDQIRLRPDYSEILASSVAVSAFSFVAACPVSAPDEDKKSDVCDNCSGTGKVGDGRISKTCQVCGGTGKKKLAQASQKSIEVYGLPGCELCLQWLARNRQQWESDGWKVKTFRDQSGRHVPWFRVVDGDSVKEVAGEFNLTTYLAWKNSNQWE